MVGKSLISPGDRPSWFVAGGSTAAQLVACIAVALALHLTLSPAIGAFGTDILVNIGIAIVLAVSLTVVNGFTGQFSIGHAGFMALGGYAAGALVYYGSFKLFGGIAPHHGGLLSLVGVSDDFTGGVLSWGDVLFVGGLILGGLLAAGAGYLVGLPSLRLRGDYLAIVTLGFGEIVRVVLQGSQRQLPPSASKKILETPWYKLPAMLGEAKGLTRIPTYSTVFWVWLVTCVTLLCVFRLKRSSYGRAMLSIREDEIAAQAMGIPVTRFKVLAFVFSAFFAGVAGGLFAMKVGAINAGELGFQRSFDIIIMVVLGGMGSISGAVLAAIILTILPELLRNPPCIWPWGLVFAAIVAGIIVWLVPAGKRLRPLLTLAGLCIAWEAIRQIAIWQQIDLAEYRMIIYALMLIALMLSRPQGLFGLNEVWDLFGRGHSRRAAKTDAEGAA